MSNTNPLSKTNSLNTVDIDYEGIRTNLKEFMKSDPNFIDYDFDGSALSSLIDMLSYVTHINAVNANIGLNETFLNTAQFRGSVVGHANMLAYTAKSCTAPNAFLDVRITKNFDPNKDWILPRGYAFKTSMGGTSYRFVTLTDYPINPSTGVFENVQVVEGSIKKAEFIYDVRARQKFTIPDRDVDISTLRVIVRPNRYSNEQETFILAQILTELRSDSLIYFVEENVDQLYEISFGDGVIGKALQDGNLIIVEYVVTHKDEANGAKIFGPSEPIRARGDDSTNTTVSVKVRSPARGGGERESIETIRKNAPLTFASQNRAVTPLDFEAIIRNNFWNTRDVKAWGGEDSDPPVYGKVFITVLPKSSNVLTPEERNAILNGVLKPKRVVTITPELVDPEFLFIRLEVFFKYNPSITNLTVKELSTKVRNRINEFNKESLDGFSKVFRYSRFVKAVDDVDPAILSTTTRVFLQKRFIPNINIPTRYELNYSSDLIIDVNRPVIERCSEFTFIGIDRCRFADRMSDTGSRVVDVVRGFGKAQKTIQRNVGQIERRKIVINNFAPQAYQGGHIMIEVVPNSNDVAASFNNVLLLDTEDPEFRIIGEVDSAQAGHDFSGKEYNATSRIRQPRN